MSTHNVHSIIDLEREAIETLQSSLSKQIGLSNESKQASTTMGDGEKLAKAAWDINRGSMEARVKAAGMVEKLASRERGATMKTIIENPNNNVISGLFGLLREGNIPHAVRAGVSALAALYNGASEEAEIRLLMTQQKGGAATLIELLAGARRAKAERVLTVLKAISLSAEGQADLSQHALTIPVLIRSLLVLSPLADELAIAVLWVLCLHNNNRGASASASALLLLEEAAQLGAAQKLLVVAQMDCNLQTKQRITDLFKAMRGLNCWTNFLYDSQRL